MTSILVLPASLLLVIGALLWVLRK